jgi:hypothetical protein
MEFNKIKGVPSLKAQEESKNEFIKSAEKKTTTDKKTHNSFPWNEPHVRNDIKKAFTVHLPEEYVLKLQYIKKLTNKSQQKVAREAICQEIDKILTDLI